MTQVPPFHNKTAVAEFVAEIIQDHRDRAEYEDAMESALPMDIPLSAWPEFRDVLFGNEQKAVAWALRGDTTGLVHLLDPKSVPNNPAWNPAIPLSARAKARPVRETLKPETWKLICEFLRGERKIVEPKPPKRKRGEQRLTEDERRERNPVHNAADEVPPILYILRQHWPAQSPGALRTRAIEIATARHRVHNSKLLRKHLSRPPGDRRRLP